MQHLVTNSRLELGSSVCRHVKKSENKDMDIAAY